LKTCGNVIIIVRKDNQLFYEKCIICAAHIIPEAIFQIMGVFVRLITLTVSQQYLQQVRSFEFVTAPGRLALPVFPKIFNAYVCYLTMI